jgi:hypothetical protein
MNEMQRIADLLDRAGHGDAWHGPSLQEILSDVATGEATMKPIPDAHSIWEIVLHIAVWEGVVTGRLEGNAKEPTKPEEDWPPIAMPGDGAWRQAVAALSESRAKLKRALLAFSETRLGETVPGKNYSFYVMAHGIVQHDLYHAGQIALLKRASRSASTSTV